MKKKQEILKQVGVYSIASQVTQIISVVVGVITRNLLGPFQMGIWSTLQIVLHYSSYAAVGTTAAIAREIPYSLGKKNPEEADAIKNAVTSFQLSTSLLLGVGVLVYVVAFGATLSGPLFWGLFGMSALIVLQRLSNLLIGLLRAYKKFELVSRQTILSSLVNGLLIVVLAYPFKIYGLIVAMILSFLFNIMYLFRRHDFHFTLDFSPKVMFGKRMRDLTAFGFPLLLMGVFVALLKTIDRIVTIKMLGFEAAGFYSVSTMAVNFLVSIPNSLGIIMIPHFGEKFAAADRAQDVKGYVGQATFGLSYVMPMIIGIAWLITPYFVTTFMPEYSEGIWATKYSILGTFFVALALPYNSLILTMKRHMSLFPMIGAAIASSVVLSVAAVRVGWGISGIAAASVISFFLYFLLQFFLVARSLYSDAEAWKELRKILGRFILMGIALTLIEGLIRFEPLLMRTCVQILIFVVSGAPFLYALNKRFGIFVHVKETYLKGAEELPAGGDGGLGT